MMPTKQNGFISKQYLLTIGGALIAALIVILIIATVRKIDTITSAAPAATQPAAVSTSTTTTTPVTKSTPPQPPEDDAPLTDTEILSRIDEYSDPDDPTKPSSLVGASDDVIRSLNPLEAADLLNTSVAVARGKSGGPRYIFNLGRIACLHGYKTLCMQLLNEAANGGSAPALAYLGQIALADGDTAKAIEYFKKAIKAGIKSIDIQKQLADLTNPKKSETPTSDTPSDLMIDLSDYDQFAGAEIMKKIISGNYSDLNAPDSDMEWLTLVYVQSVHNTLWSGGDILFMAHPKIMIELDLGVGMQAAYRLRTSRSVVSHNVYNAVNAAVPAALDAFKKMVDSLNNSRSVLEYFESIPSIAADTSRQVVDARNKWLKYKLQGEYDARRLAIGFGTEIPGNLQNREQFRKIYKAIKNYVYSK